MSIFITSQKFNNEFRPAQDLNFLLGCIGEKVTIQTDFTYEDITWCNNDNAITLKPDAFDVDLVDSTGVILDEGGAAFKDSQVGDTIVVYSAGIYTAYTITERFSDGMVRTTYGGGRVDLNPGVDYIFNGTPLAGVRYAFNLIENGLSFNSLIDGEFQQAEIATADTDNATPQTMALNGIKSWQIGGVTLTGLTGSTGVDPNYAQQKFRITHSAVITPLFLAEQYNDLVLGIKPPYYTAEKCLNYISQIWVGKNLTNPNALKTLVVPNNASNIGWFGEKFNGGLTNYSLASLVLYEGVTEIDALEFGKDITVVMTVNNTTDTPFSNTNTKYIFGFNYLPEDETLYQNNGENQTTNFLFDSKINTLGSGSVNGNNYGTDMMVIKNLTSTFVSSSQMIVTATIRIGADAQTILEQGDYKRYAMWLITENHANAADNSDKVNLLVQVSEIYEELTDTNLIQADTVFITHPYESRVDGVPTLELKPVDDIAASSNFSIDFTGLENDGILIKKISPRLVLTHATEAEIVLERCDIDVSSYPLELGLVQTIDFSQDREFHIPSEIRKTITVTRNYDADSGNVYNWNINYPFMFRWEYWEALAISNPPSGIFDRTENLNGLNQFWHRPANVTGWTLNYRLHFEVEQNGELFEQDFDTTLTSADFDSTAVWDNETIKSYDPVSLVELTSGGLKYIRGYEDVKIVASFEKISGTVPAASDVDIVIWIETYEDGGISGVRRISSAYEVSSDSWFKSIDTSNKVVVAKTGSTFTGTCLIDYTKLPKNTSYSIYARLYDNYGICSGIADEDAACILDEDSASIELE